MTRTSTLMALLSLPLSLLAAPAGAQEAPRPPPYAPEAAPWEARLAYRGSFIESAGYAPFSTNDYLPEVSLGASRLVLTRDRFALMAGAQWDYGSTGATARGADTSLTVHRLTVPLSLHYSVLRWLDVLVTVAPGAQYQGASIKEPSSPAALVASSWAPCGDASAGIVWGFAHSSIGRATLVFRLQAEAGYSLTAPMSLSMTPDLPSHSPQQVGPTNLASLAMNGAFGRVGIAVGF